MASNGFGFSQAAFQNNPPVIPIYSNRHPQRDHIPHINTDRLNTSMLHSDLQTPATGLDMNFTPLLPSNLLIGSPLQPTSPGFASPQFQTFGNFGPPQPTHMQHPQDSQQNEQQQQQDDYQQSLDSIGSPPQPYTTNVMPPDPSQSPYINSDQSPPMPYNAFPNQAFNMNMMSGMAMQQHMQPDMMSPQSRTVYLGNIPPDTGAEEVLSHVRSGQIESVRLLADKNCAFISFLDAGAATHFHSDAILKKLCIKSQDIKVGWGKPSAVPTSVALAVQQSGASRNVYLGNLPEDMTEQGLRDELSKFGPIDTVKLVKEKAIGFVHFLSIANAIKAVHQLPQELDWAPPRRVYYGKDRCAYVSKTQQQNAAQYLGIAPGYAHVLNGADRDLISNALAQQSVAAAAVATTAGGANNIGNRTVYLGNIHPETTIEEICNVVRGGLLHHIRYIPDKHICFVTFIDPTSAASFFALSNLQGLMLHNRRLKIGWGKHSGALPPALSMAVAGGASRNVYIGNLDESWSEERLRQDFSDYGEIELVNALREKSCAFVNFTNIANAITAIEAVRSRDEYKRFKVNFGKDRCGNPPRHGMPNQQLQQMHLQQQQQQMQFQQQAHFAQFQPQDMHQMALSTQALHNLRNSNSVSPAPTMQQANQFGHHPGASVTDANPLTMYLAATQGPQTQQSDNVSLSSFNANLDQGANQQAFYGNENMTLPTLGAGLQPMSQFGHQAARSVNLNMSNGFPGLQQAYQPLHKRHLSVGVMNPAHSRTISLPAFAAGATGNADGMMNGDAFNGLGAGLAGLSLGNANGQMGHQLMAQNSHGAAMHGEGQHLHQWVEEE